MFEDQTSRQKCFNRGALCDRPECSEYNSTARVSVSFRCGSIFGIRDLTVDVLAVRPAAQTEQKVHSIPNNMVVRGNYNVKLIDFLTFFLAHLQFPLNFERPIVLPQP